MYKAYQSKLDQINWISKIGGSPGLVVMGGDSRSEGREFKSQHCILDGHVIFTSICCKNCIVCLKRPKINEKWPGLTHLKKDRSLAQQGWAK